LRAGKADTGLRHHPRSGLASERAPAPPRKVVPEEVIEAVWPLEDDSEGSDAWVPPDEGAVLSELLSDAPDEEVGGRGTVKVVATAKRPRLRGEVARLAAKIENALVELGAPAHVVAASVGPTITRFGLAPAIVERYAPDGTLRRRERVRVAKIASRANDLALVLGARSLRVEAPVPGQSYVGLEVPNAEASSVTVSSLLAEKAFKEFAEKAQLPIALGRDVAGRPLFADIARLPHMLVAGTTGAGKSIALNAILVALLRLRSPQQLRVLVLDPKRVEFSWLEGVAHLLAPVVVEPEKAVETLGKLETEMTRRYDLLARAGVRDLARYNSKASTPVPCLLVVIDELADLMMVADSDVEHSICRIAQLGRAAGIHLVVATQRPSVNVVTGLIKANLPARLSFAVSSQVDSRTVLDGVGAELLLGRGDFLYQAPDAPKPVRGQGAFVSEEEVQKLAKRVRGKRGASDPYAEMFAKLQTPAARAAAELLQKARDLAIAYDDRVSASYLQRKLKIGFARAKALVEALREEGLIDGDEE
jgi:DNA segregation ATPase FtsK/SpoIIIE, S-DNA-T family